MRPARRRGTKFERISAAIKANAPLGDHVTREFVDRLQSLFQIGKSSLLDSEGPLWFRGFAHWPDADEPRRSQRWSSASACTASSPGHTPSLPGRIRARFGNRVFLIDTGMLSTVLQVRPRLRARAAERTRHGDLQRRTRGTRAVHARPRSARLLPRGSGGGRRIYVVASLADDLTRRTLRAEARRDE